MRRRLPTGFAAGSTILPLAARESSSGTVTWRRGSRGSWVVGVTRVTSRFDTADIKRYYDRHSASFVRFGQGRASIHRAVWGPGTRTREDAFHYIDEQIAVAVRRFVSPSRDVHVVDLGCGVGASLCYLAERLPIRGTGITLSPAQAAMARQVVAAAGLSQRVECIEGDYCDLPATLTPSRRGVCHRIVRAWTVARALLQ